MEIGEILDLSIIIVNWNAKEYLKNCLDSLIADLSGMEYEIIVVDNASIDGSQEIVKTFYPEVKLICNRENLGFAKANNIGINYCSGRVLFLINSDVMIHEGCFKKMIAFLEANSKIGLVGPRILDKNGRLQRSIMFFPTIWNILTRALAIDILSDRINWLRSYEAPLNMHKRMIKVEIINGCFMMIRRKALQEVGLLDERFFIYGEDIDWCKRFNDLGWGVAYFSGVSVTHFGGASSSTAPIKFYLEMLKADYKLWKKYYRTLYCFVFLLIQIFHHLNRFYGFALQAVIKPSLRSNSIYKIRKNAMAVRWAIKEIWENLGIS